MGEERASPDSVLACSYNLLYLFEDDSAAGREHYRLVVETIRTVAADVLAVQEIRAPTAATAADRLRQLAADAGMNCLVPAPGVGEGRAAVGVGARGFHVGLMWRDGIEPVGGSLRSYGARDFWHSLACVTVDVGGQLVRHAAHHSTPFGRRQRADQNERLVAVLRKPRGLPTVVGADWNTECADRVLDQESGDWVLYEPRDPFADTSWFDAMIYQCEWDYDSRGRRRHWADRQPGEVLWAGGLYDAAAALRAPWQATVGHHLTDGFGTRGVKRRIDGIRVTAEVLGALRAHRVVDTDLARRASDHLPVTVEYRPSAIAVAPGGGC
jgi:endonuclease/exonuclease/phosphatase family metal-dependent hydrolase